MAPGGGPALFQYPIINPNFMPPVLLHEAGRMASRLPGPRGPIEQLRTAYGMQFNPVDAVVRLHERYGTVVEFGVRPFRYVVLYGAEANKLILADRVDAFRWRTRSRCSNPSTGPPRSS